MKQRMILWLLLIVVVISSSALAQASRAGNPRGYSPDALLDVFKLAQADSDVPFATLLQGCPARDCIPSIDAPSFVPVGGVDYLRADDLLMVVSLNGTTRGYPTRILDHHEIVNDSIAGVPVVVSYCPLCGSGLVFERRQDGQVLEFGVSSLLHNNDLVMYDRQTESLWQQITGKAFAGKSRGAKLKSLPVAMASWEGWAAENPDASVLTVEGIKTDHYMKDAYKGYAESDTIYMPVSATDARLHPKRVVYALEIGQQALAIDSDWLSKQRHWSKSLNGEKLQVSMGRDGEVEASLGGVEVAITRMYWFAWYSFHPQTALINGQ